MLRSLLIAAEAQGIVYDLSVPHREPGGAAVLALLEKHGISLAYAALQIGTVQLRRHRRRTDAYTPGGVTGKRPDYATVVYCNLIRRSFPKIPILIGGIEASLRRLAHYDYWSDSLKRSILLDSQADLLLYGMGERAIVEVAAP